MGLPATCVWEVQPTSGNDANGGFFVAGASGTDMTYPTSSPVALTGLTTAAANAIILTASATAAMVGNGINITGGTNFITGIYQVVSVVVGVSITVDRNCTTAAGALGTANVGGAIKTITQLITGFVNSNTAWIKAESTINTSVDFRFSSPNVTPTETVPQNKITGYSSTRGDNGRVTIAPTGGAIGLRFDGAGWRVSGFNITCASSGNNGIRGATIEVDNCKISNATNAGIDLSGGEQSSVHHCEITGCGAAGVYLANSSEVHECWIHDNTSSGILIAGNGRFCTIRKCVISNNTGSTSDGIQNTGGAIIVDNVIYKNGRHGINITGVSNIVVWYCRNNIITDHTAGSAAGIKCATSALPADPRWDGNFYYNNTSNRVNMDDTSTNPINGVNPYTNVFDVQLTASPFTAASSNDFTLNNTAGGGAAVRGKGYPGVGGTVFSGIPGLSQTGYLDGGVFQHQDSGGGGGVFFGSSNLDGGLS